MPFETALEMFPKALGLPGHVNLRLVALALEDIMRDKKGQRTGQRCHFPR
jgi:hypothetical protein